MSILIAIKIAEISDTSSAATYISQSIWEDEVADLFKLNYRFAVSSIDERVGTYKAWQVEIKADGGRRKTPINLVDCETFAEDEEWTHFLGLKQVKRQLGNILCPDVDSLKVAGVYGDDGFMYVEIAVVKCDSQLNDDCLEEH